MICKSRNDGNNKALQTTLDREQTLDTVEEVSANAYLLEHERWNFNAFPLSRMETPTPPFFSIKCLGNYSVSMMYQMSACIELTVHINLYTYVGFILYGIILYMYKIASELLRPIRLVEMHPKVYTLIIRASVCCIW